MTVRRLTAVLAAATVLMSACGSDSTAAPDDPATTTTPADDTESSTTAPAEDEILRILVTNDDGVGAPGIDSLVNAVSAIEGVEVTVVAPADNQSGTGDKTTDGELAVAEAATASGVAATAVTGFPADSVVWAIGQGNVEPLPHLVVSGNNFGQNIGNLSTISGTVGAALTAARAGIPALAVSQGAYGDVTEPDFESGSAFAVEWIEENRRALLDGSVPAEVTSINAPTCVVGSVRGLVEVPTAADIGERDPFAVDCESSVENPADDVDALANGYASISVIAA